MWRFFGYLILGILCIIPGALLGAICGAIYLPIKVCSLIAESGNGNEVDDDEI